MDNINKIKEILEEEYRENRIKINELSRKERIVEANGIDSKLSNIVGFSMIPWVLMMIPLPLLVKYNIIPINLVSSLSTGIPIALGVTSEILLEKRNKCKDMLKNFSKAKNQKELMKESTKYEIEIEKLNSLNSILRNSYSKLSEKQNAVSSLSFEYDITLKKEDDRTLTEIENDIKSLNETLEQNKKDINILVTKKVLEKKFWRFKDKFQKVVDFITFAMLGGIGFMLIYDLPIVLINNLFSNIELQTSILTMLAPFVVGGLVCESYAIKRAKDNIHAFKNINKELGEHKLEETCKDNDTESYDLKLEKLISDACDIRIKLEEEKQKNIIKSDLETKKYSIDDNLKQSDNVLLEKIDLAISSIVKETEGPKLVKKRTFKN